MKRVHLPDPMIEMFRWQSRGEQITGWLNHRLALEVSQARQWYAGPERPSILAVRSTARPLPSCVE